MKTVTIDGTSIGSASNISVVIDGKVIPGAQSVRTVLTADEPPVVNLKLSLGKDIKTENASIMVSDVTMPESVEHALWEYLAARYARAIDVTKLNSKRLPVIDVATLDASAQGAGRATGGCLPLWS